MVRQAHHGNKDLKKSYGFKKEVFIQKINAIGFDFKCGFTIQMVEEPS